jgi:hypothetical protein
MKLFTILLPLIYTSEYVYICAYAYKSLDCSSYVAIRSGFRVSNQVSVIREFGFGNEFSPESVFGSVSGFKFGFRFWVPRQSTRSEPDLLPSLDIKDGFATSSKEHLRSLVRVHELDEITSNGGKDRSATKEHPRGLKRKRPNFMRGESPSWTRG